MDSKLKELEDVEQYTHRQHEEDQVMFLNNKNIIDTKNTFHTRSSKM